MTTTDLTVPSAAPDFMASAMQSFESVQRLAELMAKCGTLPKHLQGQPADCFRVVVQAAKWRMDPFSVAECTSVVHGRLCFEGKLVAAVLRSMGAIEGRLEYDVKGSGANASITITGTPRGGKPQTLTGDVKTWRTVTRKDGKVIPNAWDSMPETMLIYRGTRQWARQYAPEAILGVYTPDELEDVREVEYTQAPAEPQAPKRRRVARETDTTTVGSATVETTGVTVEPEAPAEPTHQGHDSESLPFGDDQHAEVPEVDQTALMCLANLASDNGKQKDRLTDVRSKIVNHGGVGEDGGAKLDLVPAGRRHALLVDLLAYCDECQVVVPDDLRALRG